MERTDASSAGRLAPLAARPSLVCVRAPARRHIQSSKSAAAIIADAAARGVNLRPVGASAIGISVDERTTGAHLSAVAAAFGIQGVTAATLEAAARAAPALPSAVARGTPFLTHPVFNTHRSETQLLRYLAKLEAKDLSLTTSMISLGSCTMKLNATSEMAPVTWPEFADIHPFAPASQTAGYAEMINGLSDALCRLTGFAAASMQPNSGAAGEYAGLMAIRAWHASRGDTKRDVCLIPVSAHGTNPASAVMAGMRVVVVASDDAGNVDITDLKAKAEQHKDRLAALMITYPSTYGVFEGRVKVSSSIPAHECLHCLCDPCVACARVLDAASSLFRQLR